MLFEKLKNLKASPVTTVMGLLSGAFLWLSTQPVLDGHPSGKQLAQLASAAFVALLGGFASDGAPPKA